MTSRTRLERKQADDILGGEEMWKHADSTAGEVSFASLFTWFVTGAREDLTEDLGSWLITPVVPQLY